jgi:predicted secreted hydrolase
MTDSAITLPQDAYLHVGAPTEWWWHIGTLQAPDRIFGFEINAAGFASVTGLPPVCFTQVMLSDPTNNAHYQATTGYLYHADWAEADTSQPWYAKLGPGFLAPTDWVSMKSDGTNINVLTVQASFTDAATKTVIAFDLQMTQSGPPLLHWGEGIAPNVNPQGKTPLERNNYYYSFTNLAVTGTVQIGAESFPVTGVTLMDHEYGAFSPSTRWILQDIQLSNGVAISNSISGDTFTVAEGVPTPTYASILENGVNTFLENTTATPTQPWINDGTTYFLNWEVDIPGKGTLVLEAVMADQLFGGDQRPIYEGAATLTVVGGTYDGQSVTGTGWIEQALAPLKPTATHHRPPRGHHAHARRRETAS